MKALPQIVNSAAYQESDPQFSEVDVKKTATTGQRKSDAEPREIKSLKCLYNSNGHLPGKGAT